MSNQIEVTAKYVKSLSPAAVATDKAIGEHFVNKFMAMYRVPKVQATAFYEREKDNFLKRISDSEDLQACTPMSIFLAFMQVGGWQLSFEPGNQSEVYLIPGNRNIAPKNQAPQWIKEVVAQPTPWGEKKIRIQNGQVKDVAKPIIVCKGDIYEEYLDENGNLRVKWAKGDRGEKPVIIGSFIRIEKPDGSFEIKTFDMSDVEKWKSSSAKKNKDKGANALYTSNNGQIDKMFFEGKTLKHAFKSYPKVVNAPKLPETFVPAGSDAIRQGFDVTEFTEEATYEQLPDQQPDEFTQALEEESKPEHVETKQFVAAGDDDDDEPKF
jgi:recombinational DNA repair protein RecT